MIKLLFVIKIIVSVVVFILLYNALKNNYHKMVWSNFLDFIGLEIKDPREFKRLEKLE